MGGILFYINYIVLYKRKKSRKPLILLGLQDLKSQAENETRTHDPFITSEVLYRLSYVSLCCSCQKLTVLTATTFSL